jgi:hypothetical protein
VKQLDSHFSGVRAVEHYSPSTRKADIEHAGESNCGIRNGPACRLKQEDRVRLVAEEGTDRAYPDYGHVSDAVKLLIVGSHGFQVRGRNTPDLDTSHRTEVLWCGRGRGTGRATGKKRERNGRPVA